MKTKQVLFQQRLHTHKNRPKWARYISLILHEKNFWGIIAILFAIMALIALLALFSKKSLLDQYQTPTRLYLSAQKPSALLCF